MKNETILGVDIGGTGIKCAIINSKTGELLTERIKCATPQPSKPEAVVEALVNLMGALDFKGNEIGVGFPAIVKDGIAKTAANVDKDWIGTDIEKIIAKATGKKVKALNDADAAGMAEMSFGKGKKQKGVVILITIGTGIGSAVFMDGVLVQNTEMGHCYMQGHTEVAEKYCSNSARKTQGLDWETWGKRFNEFLQYIERLFAPNMIILGGGVSKKFDNYKEYFDVEAEVVPAHFQNAAGVIGAAMYAKSNL